MKRRRIQVRAFVTCPHCQHTHEPFVEVDQTEAERALAHVRGVYSEPPTVPWPARLVEEARLNAARRAAEERTDREAESHVYVICNPRSNQVKIGRSENPRQRLQDLQRESGELLELVAIVGDGSTLERRLHMRFAGARGVGEWFHASHPDIAPWLASLSAERVE